MDLDRHTVRTWLRNLLSDKHETPTGLARRAGVAQTTLTRFLNSADGPMLGRRTLAKIAHATGSNPPGLIIASAPPAEGPPAAERSTGLRESEAGPISGEAPLDQALSDAIRALVAGRDAADAWRLRGDALVNAGYLAGDILIVDLNATPAAGNLVCAQIYKWNADAAETLFRFYEPPYLVAASSSIEQRRPLVVDNETVVIKGIVTHMLRLAR